MKWLGELGIDQLAVAVGARPAHQSSSARTRMVLRLLLL
jgi:hypothetical protein